jgi:hypothetical protein
MGSVHLLNMLALHVPNPLPKTVPWFEFHWEHGWFLYKRSAFPRHAGRLIWASLLFIGGVIIAYTWIKRPAKPHWPLFKILGAMVAIWAVISLISIAVNNNWSHPGKWAIPGYVGFVFLGLWLFIAVLSRRPIQPGVEATWAQTILGALGVWIMFVLGYGVIPSEWIIFGNSYLNFDSSAFIIKQGQWATRIPPFNITRDKIVDGVATLIYIIVLTLNVALFVAWQKRKAAETEADVATTADAPRGPIARLRARREERVSAYGRPVTTSES